MSYSYTARSGGATIVNGVTAVECHKQVRSWRFLRSILELLIPICNNLSITQHPTPEKPVPTNNISSIISRVTGTIFGYRHGKVSFCIQKDSTSTTPSLLLGLTIPTTILAKEMQGGVLRIELVCNEFGNGGVAGSSPIWTMYCNGKKVGFAIKKRPLKADIEMLRLMGNVNVGAGAVSNVMGELMYLRGNFERVSGSTNIDQSYHLIDPEGSIGQELSIVFHRSR